MFMASNTKTPGLQLTSNFIIDKFADYFLD